MTDKNVTNKRDNTGETVSQSDLGEDRPKMPHERDESNASQASKPREIIKQAYDDVQSDQEDTDLRGNRGERKDAVPKSS